MSWLTDEQHKALTELFRATAEKEAIERRIEGLELKAMRIQTPLDDPETLSCEDDEEYEPTKRTAYRLSKLSMVGAALVLLVLAWSNWTAGATVSFPAWLILTVSCGAVLAVAREGMRR